MINLYTRTPWVRRYLVRFVNGSGIIVYAVNKALALALARRLTGLAIKGAGEVGNG